VAAAEEVVIARLKAYKHFTEEQARARIAAQLSNEARMAQADKVLWNNEGLPELRRTLEAAWQRLR
jgi:dephospho-CoA kinase